MNNGNCLICGAPLINSPDGVGYGCREMVKKCTYLHMKSNEDKTAIYAYWNVDCDIYMKYFIPYYEDKKTSYRSAFKKSFVPSVIKFYKEKGFLSKKQFDIFKKIADEELDSDMFFVEGDIKNKKDEIALKYRKENWDSIVELTHKMWAKEKA